MGPSTTFSKASVSHSVHGGVSLVPCPFQEVGMCRWDWVCAEGRGGVGMCRKGVGIHPAIDI